MNRKLADKPPMIIVKGSCIQFEKERPKIMDFIASLESRVRLESKCECSSSGKALGWDFFQIYFVPEFIGKLLEVYPEIEKQEGNDVEQRFVLWLNKEMKKARLEYYLKLGDVPRESVGGFRLNPEAYRDDKELEKLR